MEVQYNVMVKKAWALKPETCDQLLVPPLSSWMILGKSINFMALSIHL